MLKVFLAKDFTYIQSRGFSVEEHGQIAPQISVSTGIGVLHWDQTVTTGVYYPSGEPHILSSPDIIHTFLLNPEHSTARGLARTLSSSRAFDASSDTRVALDRLSFRVEDGPAIVDRLEQLYSQIVDGEPKGAPLDERIQEALSYIDKLEEKRVAAGALAEKLSLSESRFLHLFKEELRVTVRRYLLWRRTRDCTRLVVEGMSITAASHRTGFTDSAHFSKVFKQLFGVTPTVALGGEPRPVLVVGEV